MAQREEAEVILKVNSKEAQEKLEKLEAQAAELRNRFAEAFRKGDTTGIDTINRQLQKVNKQIDNMRTNAANIRAAMVRLNEASPRELQRTIKLINNELNSGRVKRGTKEWDDYVGKLKDVQNELTKVKKEMTPDNKESLLDRLKNGINDWGATAAAATAAFAGVVMSGKAAVQAYADMEAEEANVRKFTGMTAEEVGILNEKFKEIDTRTSREDLNKLAQEAGRLGKTSVKDVLGFVRAADQLNVALDDLGSGATLTLSKLTGIFGDEARYGTEQSLLKVGSVINELSQNCSASAPYLAEFSSRLGGIAAQSKMSISQVMAFAAVLDTQNLAVEASATAVGQLITKIYQEPAKIAKAAGLDVQKFSSTVKTDMNGALVMLFEHLNKFGGMETLAGVFDNMGTDGARAIPVLAALSGHIEELKWQQDQASEAFREGISVTNEFNVQNNTVQAQLDKARKGFNEMAVSLGEKLLPVMRYCISGTSLLMRVISVLVDFIIKNKAGLLGLSAAVFAYTVAVKAATVAQIAHNVSTAAGTVATKAATAAKLLFASAINLVAGNTRRATAALRLFSSVLKANHLGHAAAAATAFIASVAALARRMRQSRIEAQKHREELARLKKEATDVESRIADSASKEIAVLKNLYKAATNEANAKEQRIKAAQDLIALYPDQFKNMTAEQITLGKAKKAYDNLTQSIINNAKAKAAAELVLENEKKILELEQQLKGHQEDYDKADKKIQDIAADNSAREGQTFSNMYQAGAGAPTRKSDAQARADRAEAAKNMRETKSEINTLQKAVDSLTESYKENAEFRKAMTPEVDENPAPPPVLPESEKELEAEQKAAKEALKKALDERKSMYLKAEAENLTGYVTGQQNYAAYLARKEQLDKDYADDVVKIHEQHNKIDIVAYGQALKAKADLLKKQQNAERKRSLDEAEAEHKENTDAATAAYFDPSSTVFQDKKKLNQMLFQEDVRYLTEKRDLYLKNSEEWESIDRQINERIAQDQLDKKKETADALLAFEKQYRQASGSRREKAELDILEELHRQQLISEEEYQKAIRDIKQKNRDEDIEKARQTQSEYSDMVLNLYSSITKLFEELSNGVFRWDDFAKAAEAAVIVMSAALSQYSAYANAERDLELAKTEKRYDKEIAAAGKNSKKKEKLEKQKEEAIAKIKKKYNDKAMKLELAQAIAQTAVAAINAYASAAKTAWWLGPIAAAMATAAGMVQVATIKKQHEAQAAGFYEGGFTPRDGDNRREVGVVHANEFVANHQAVANPALAPVLRLIDTAQRTNTVGSLSAADVSNAIGQGSGVSARGDVSRAAAYDSALIGGLSAMAQTNIAANEVMKRLSDAIEGGIEAKVILDGEDGFHKKYNHYQKLINNPKR